jgi:hypothetical protein
MEGCISSATTKEVRVRQRSRDDGRATPELAKRNTIFMTLGAVVLLGIVAIVGINDERVWPLIALEVLYTTPLLILRKTRKGHSLKCGLRYALYTTY